MDLFRFDNVCDQMSAFSATVYSTVADFSALVIFSKALVVRTI